MSYAAYPYGGASYGGSSASGDATASIATQNLSLTLHTPIWVVKHSNPALFALGLTVHAPTVKVTNHPSTLTLSLTQYAPDITSAVIVQVPTLTLTTSLYAPNPRVTVAPDTLDLTLTLSPSGGEVIKGPSTFNLGLTLHAPTVKITFKPTGDAAPFRLGVYAGFAPGIGSLQPRIVRYIKDPQVTSGCSQCGTLLYSKRGKPVRGTRVGTGENFDKNLPYNEEQYIRCGRCGFINHPTRNLKAPEGSRQGWGMRYVEVEAGAE